MFIVTSSVLMNVLMKLALRKHYHELKRTVGRFNQETSALTFGQRNYVRDPSRIQICWIDKLLLRDI